MTRLTKQDVMRDLGYLLDDLVDGRDSDIQIEHEEETVLMVTLTWENDLSPDATQEGMSPIPGWHVYAGGIHSEFPYLGSIEADWDRDYKIYSIREMLMQYSPDLMPEPDVAPVPTAPRKEQVVILSDRLGQKLGVFGSLGCAMKHLLDHKDVTLDQAKWTPQEAGYETLNGFKAEVWEVQRWET